MPGFQAINDAGSANTDFGIRATTIRLATGSSERVRIDSSGNVGIGTDNPAQPLSVMKNSNTSNTTPIAVFDTEVAGDYGIVEIDSGADNNYRPSTLRFKEGGNLKWEIGGTYQLTDDSFGIRTGVATDYKMVIKPNGNVGIGGTDPTALLHLYTSGSTPINMGIQNSTRYYKIEVNSGDLQFFDISAYAERMRISSNGSIGAPNGTNIYNASDERLKQNITTLSNSLDVINALNPVQFNWIDNFEESENGKNLYGFVAQEVQDVFPDAVESFGTGDDIEVDGTVIQNPLTVRDKFFIPVLVKALQEQQIIIDDLKSRIETLEE